MLDNTHGFLAGRPSNNVLPTGSRGSGKSSLVKALLTEFAEAGLRLVEVDKDDLIDLPTIAATLSARPEFFILFCDDLSFEANNPGHKTLKATLDGGLSAVPSNVLIYATSNRRHLIPKFFTENLETQRQNGEIPPGESSEEKILPSERFGLWLSFYTFSQDDYLLIVAHWLNFLDCTDIPAARQAALNWAIERGPRSDRVAWQFACHWMGQMSEQKNAAQR